MSLHETAIADVVNLPPAALLHSDAIAQDMREYTRRSESTHDDRRVDNQLPLRVLHARP